MLRIHSFSNQDHGECSTGGGIPDTTPVADMGTTMDSYESSTFRLVKAANLLCANLPG